MDIEIFAINASKKSNQPRQLILNNKQYKSAIDSFKNEISYYELSAEIHQIDIGDLPNQVKSSMIIIADNTFYVEDDYLNKVISINNLLRDGGIFCGPTSTHTHASLNNGVHKINQKYQRYNLDYGHNVISDITGEIHLYPDLLYCAISGRAYNDFSYKPVISYRHKNISNKLFIAQMSHRYHVYYCGTLGKIKYLDETDFSMEKISDFYYDSGYQDGLLVSNKNLDEKRKELWHRFVESPEMLDNEMPRWLLDSNPDMDGDYLENLVICKCKYQIGFYEGMLSRKLI